MKKIQKIFHAVFILFLTVNGYNQSISTHFFGQNAWMPDTVGNAGACTDPPCILNGQLHQQWGNVKNSKASIIRFGGIAADKNMPTRYQYIRMIDSIRTNGMEPMIQVPFANYRYTAQQAADLVYYVNITSGKNIKYWIIANEPDLSYSFNSSSQIAAYFKPFASAMKNSDPSILIVGPEISSFNQNIISGLTTPNSPDDITGRDPSGKFYLDIISFHTYPFNGSQTRQQVISRLTEPYSLQDNLVYLNTRVAACNTTHNRTGASALKTAITEGNINWQNNASDNLSGVGANSFIGGQFVAEMMGIAMKNGVDIFNFWSVVEGGSVINSIGYLDPVTGNKKPSYYHFKLMASNFRGNYAACTSSQANVKSFACNDGQQVSVLILNEDMNNFNYTVRLNTAAVTGNNPLKINVNTGIGTEYNDAIQGQATVLLTFNLSGTLIRKQEYSLNGNAVANQPPTVTEFLPTSVSANVNAEQQGQGFFELRNIFPNPSVGKFTIDLHKGSTSEKEFEVQIFNLLGQEVYSKKFLFLNGKEEIELSPAIADGEYILRIKEGTKDNFQTRKIILQK